MRNIIKRDGTVRPYEPEKIITAMGKAFRETAAGTSRAEMAAGPWRTYRTLWNGC